MVQQERQNSSIGGRGSPIFRNPLYDTRRFPTKLSTTSSTQTTGALYSQLSNSFDNPSACTSTMTSTNVELVVYDLSRGMARSLSAQFLGPQYAIDIIPHTAVVVFGREYFFGGGIQHEDPQQFRRYAGMHPIQTLSLGSTSVSRSDFEAWCQQATNNGRYTAASYETATIFHTTLPLKV